MDELKHICRLLAALLCLVLSTITSYAADRYNAEVGIPFRASALTVLSIAEPLENTSLPITDGHTEVTDTVKSYEQMARELQEEYPYELSDPDSTGGHNADSLSVPIDTTRIGHLADSLKLPLKALPKPRFVPNPTRALWLSLVLPGAGQIYNRKYWKLPFIYGGFLGCAYALMWNQMMYRDYSQAYLDIMDDDPNTHSYLDMLPPRYDITGREEQFKNLFKRKKDYYRRYRDLSAFCFVGVYLLSVIDAYVDAQLSVFDISPDLSMSVEPAVIGAPTMLGSTGRAAYGVGVGLRF